MLTAMAFFRLNHFDLHGIIRVYDMYRQQNDAIINQVDFRHHQILYIHIFKSLNAFSFLFLATSILG